ncbi:hypothetical protein FACS1894199_04420 [Bacteroidia bacterium]|nr:hypothetical protein FACS1894199_04420 [Bacteroidia bacterium]
MKRILDTKRILFIVTFIICSIGGTSTSGQTSKSVSFVGVWQKFDLLHAAAVKQDPASGAVYLDTNGLRPGSAFKILNDENDFTNIWISKNTAMVSGFGKYVFPTPTTYIEHTLQSLSNPQQNGQDIVFSYLFYGENCLLMSYKAGYYGTLWEVWVRVISPNPMLRIRDEMLRERR